MILRSRLVGPIAFASMLVSSTALAQGNTVIVPNSPPAQQAPPAQPTYVQPAPAVAPAARPVGVEEEQEEWLGPSRRWLFTAGLATFGIFYGTSVIVAGASNHPGDGSLYVPIAGPWIDIGSRGTCGGPNDTRTCDQETGNKVLLGMDGVLQAAGAAMVIGALVAPRETRVIRPVAGVEMTVTPTTYGRNGAGVSAIGSF